MVRPISVHCLSSLLVQSRLCQLPAGRNSSLNSRCSSARLLAQPLSLFITLPFTAAIQPSYWSKLCLSWPRLLQGLL